MRAVIHLDPLATNEGKTNVSSESCGDTCLTLTGNNAAPALPLNGLQGAREPLHPRAVHSHVGGGAVGAPAVQVSTGAEMSGRSGALITKHRRQAASYRASLWRSTVLHPI